MTKKLNVDQIQSELAGSVFFPTRPTEIQQQPADDASAPPIDGPPSEPEPSFPAKRTPSTAPRRASRASKRESTAASTQASELASTLAHDSPAVIEAIRKIVRISGKEVSYVRLTPGEKDELADIIYTYKRRGTKTTENEISRIAVNYILADYKENGENSVLARVLDALRA